MKKTIFALLCLFSFVHQAYATPAPGTDAWKKHTEQREQQKKDYMLKQPVKICVDGIQYLIFESSPHTDYPQKTVTVAYDSSGLNVKRCYK
jgi:hypothetical protein